MSKKKEPVDGPRVVVRCSAAELQRWKKKAAPKPLSLRVRELLEGAK